MNTNQEKQTTPKGFTTVCPYLIVKDVEAQTEFLQIVFDADLKDELRNPNGIIVHATLTIGNTTIMVTETTEELPINSTASNYVFVENVDSIYEIAVAEGALSIAKPEDTTYGNRESRFRDPEGNIWWIAQNIRTVTSERIERLVEERN